MKELMEEYGPAAIGCAATIGFLGLFFLLINNGSLSDAIEGFAARIYG